METNKSISLFSKIPTNDKYFNDQNSLRQINIMSNWKFAEKSMNSEYIENKEKFMEKVKGMIPFFKEEEDKVELKKNNKHTFISESERKKFPRKSIIFFQEPHLGKNLKGSASEKNLLKVEMKGNKREKNNENTSKEIFNIFDNILSSKTIIDDHFYRTNIVKLKKFKKENGFKDCEVSTQVKNLKKEFFVSQKKTKEPTAELDVEKIITNTHFMNLITKFNIIKGDDKKYKEFRNYCYNIYGVKEPALSNILSIDESTKALKKSQSDHNIRKGFISHRTQGKSPRTINNMNKNNISKFDTSLTKFSLNIIDKINTKRSRNLESLPEINLNKHSSRNNHLESYRSIKSNCEDKPTKPKAITINTNMNSNIDSQRFQNEYIMNSLQDSFVKSKLLLNTFSKKTEKSRENIEITYNRYFSNKGDLYEKGIIRHLARESIGKFKEKGEFFYGSNYGYYSNSKKKLLGLI